MPPKGSYLAWNNQEARHFTEEAACGWPFFMRDGIATKLLVYDKPAKAIHNKVKSIENSIIYT